MSDLLVKFARRDLQKAVNAGEWTFCGQRSAVALLIADGERQEAALDLWKALGADLDLVLSAVIAAQGDSVSPELIALQHRLASRLRPSSPANTSFPSESST